MLFVKDLRLYLSIIFCKRYAPKEFFFDSLAQWRQHDFHSIDDNTNLHGNFILVTCFKFRLVAVIMNIQWSCFWFSNGLPFGLNYLQSLIVNAMGSFPIYQKYAVFAINVPWVSTSQCKAPHVANNSLSKYWNLNPNLPYKWIYFSPDWWYDVLQIYGSVPLQ
jgi:hypothetical protein